MNYSSIKNDNLDNLFTDYEDIPSESDPFCNCTENSSYNESYSNVIPAFFFRNKKCSLKPSAYEKKKLRYFYNTAGIILSAKLIIEVSLCILFYIFMIMSAFSINNTASLFYSVLADSTVRYCFKTIAVIISTLSVFFAGCRFSSLSPALILKGNPKIRTSDIINFFMAGLFIYSVQNLIDFFTSYFTETSPVWCLELEENILQTAAAAIFTCIVSPVAEGIIFRGIVLKNLSRASQRFGILTVSLLCALSSGCFHRMIPVFMMSVILSKLTVKYNSVIPSILIHITLNISSFIISAYGTYVWESDVLITKLWTAITFITGGIFAVITVIKNPLPKQNLLQKKRTYPIFFSSFFIILVIVLYLVSAFAELIAFMYL